MTFCLSQDDVARLLNEPAREARIELVQKLAEGLDSPALTEAELGIAEDIIRMLGRDIELLVREVLSASLRSSPRLPHDVAVQLAADVESVALPILAGSVVLTDLDLVAIVRNSSSVKQAAVARRDGVSTAVSDALITYGDEHVVSALMANRSAEVSEAGFNRAIDRFGNADLVTSRMVDRDRLPITVAERLAVVVSEHLRQHLVRKHSLPPGLASDIVLEGRETAILALGRGATAPNLRELVAQMRQNNRLTPSLILNAVCMGDIAFFEAALAEMAAISTENAQTLIHDAGQNGLQALYGKSGLPPELYPAFRAAVDTIQVTRFDGEAQELERYRSRVIARVLTQVESIETESADYLVSKLQKMAQSSLGYESV